ncbi:MAG: TIGR02147 family protein [Chitinispirillaceae bacterium]|jgi:uncharacterized protein (TIGR02147 family)
MPDISTYTDYRKFLKDYYAEVKAENPGFSYLAFARMAGLNSKGFTFNIFSGKRTLSRANILGFIQAMQLDKYEAEYFENLVAFNQAKNLKERSSFFERLSSIKAGGKTVWAPQLVRNDQYQYYAKLHHSVIRSLIDLYGFNGDYAWLGRNVRPKISAAQAQKSVKLLERLGFIRRKGKSFVVVDKTITSPPEVQSLAVQNFHEQAAGLAMKAVSELPRDQRNMSGATVGISREGYKKICEEINVFRTRLLQIAEDDRNADAVYQINFQLFPVSRTDIERNAQ